MAAHLDPAIESVTLGFHSLAFYRVSDDFKSAQLHDVVANLPLTMLWCSDVLLNVRVCAVSGAPAGCLQRLSLGARRDETVSMSVMFFSAGVF